jgi:purine-nucleoside phosphorylase
MGDNPLLGMMGPLAGSARFVEMANDYDAWLSRAAEEAAAAAGVVLRRGVLACVPGPSYETAAEADKLGRLGALSVSMSVVPEVIVARALRLRVMGLAVLTNRSGALLDSRVGHQQVVATAESRAKAVALVLEGVLHRLAAAPSA